MINENDSLPVPLSESAVGTPNTSELDSQEGFKYKLEAQTDHAIARIPIGGRLESEDTFFHQVRPEEFGGDVCCHLAIGDENDEERLVILGLWQNEPQSLFLFNGTVLKQIIEGTFTEELSWQQALDGADYLGQPISNHRYVITKDGKLEQTDTSDNQQNAVAAITFVRDKEASEINGGSAIYRTLEIEALGDQLVEVQYATEERQILKDPDRLDILEYDRYSPETMKRKVEELQTNVKALKPGASMEFDINEVNGNLSHYECNYGTNLTYPNVLDEKSPFHFLCDLGFEKGTGQIIESTDEKGYQMIIEVLGVKDAPSYKDLLEFGFTTKRKEGPNEKDRFEFNIYSQPYNTQDGKVVTFKMEDCGSLSSVDSLQYAFRIIVVA